MRELDRALADIGAIRQQIARADGFRSYGPATVAATGLLAALVAAVQALGGGADASAPAYIATWVAAAAVSILLVGAEAPRRRRGHATCAPSSPTP